MRPHPPKERPVSITTSTRPNVEELSEPASWAHLRTVSLARIAVTAGDGADIFPMNFMIHDGAIYLRSAPGLKMIDFTAHPAVALEADGTDGRATWSVVVRGIAIRLIRDTDIEASAIRDLPSQTPWDKFNYIRITPTRITGRRFTMPVSHTE
jgi:nitroimidazol reductase NimA-like FMN-containing flavoprotein (pyridoxamine 5'-phosphate oxidase superfamily)